MTRPGGALIVHGHFYQPPRENPWSGVIETQPSAAPFPNWNARIAAECYHPNGRARLLDAQGQIRALVNNYRFLSFNVGPTLLAWLEAHAPQAYAAMRAADREQASAPGGGNAIAQAYTHAILPLASRRDKVTHVRWGLADFRHRFGRAAEALWLPEMAVDGETLAVLAEHGLRYVLLSPEQAQRVRPGEHAAWLPAERALDVRRAYRLRPAGAAGGRPLAALFFHGPLSRGIAFEGLARSAPTLAERIAEAFASPPAGPRASGAGLPERVLLLCCDGETFGHHQRFAEMALARLFEVECPERGIAVTTPARYLAAHPPAWEVELREPSSWSCPHGVGRWAEDCGCSTGGLSGWHQRWRAPLRAGLGRLRAACDRIFERAGGRLLADPWAARDDYIQVLLDPSEEARRAFLARHARRADRPGDRSATLRLLEMQTFCLLMDTSCAWFFADVSGIEAAQNLRYAAAAIEMARPFTEADLEADLVAALARAPSNDPAWQDGAQVYARAARPSVVTPDRALHRHAVAHLLGEAPGASTAGYVVEPLAAARQAAEGIEIAFGGARLRWPRTDEEAALAYLAVRAGPFDVRTAIFPWEGELSLRRSVAEATAGASGDGGRIGGVVERLADRFGPLRRLADLRPDDQRAILDALLAAASPPAGSVLDPLYEARRGGLVALAEAGLPLPEDDRAVATAVLRARATSALRALPPVPDAADLAPALRAVTEAKALGLPLDLPEARSLLEDRLARALAALDLAAPPGAVAASLAAAGAAEALCEAARRLDLRLDPGPAQEALFPVLSGPLPDLVGRAAGGDQEAYALAVTLLRLAQAHGFAVDDLRARLASLEFHLAADPRVWP
jgi:alpha-amylase/alpha-mannosidase (GH57 family)